MPHIKMRKTYTLKKKLSSVALTHSTFSNLAFKLQKYLSINSKKPCWKAATLEIHLTFLSTVKETQGFENICNSISASTLFTEKVYINYLNVRKFIRIKTFLNKNLRGSAWKITMH